MILTVTEHDLSSRVKYGLEWLNNLVLRNGCARKRLADRSHDSNL